MSVVIDYTTIAVVSMVTAFFSAFGTEVAKEIVIYAKNRVRNKK